MKEKQSTSLLSTHQMSHSLDYTRFRDNDILISNIPPPPFCFHNPRHPIIQDGSLASSHSKKKSILRPKQPNYSVNVSRSISPKYFRQESKSFHSFERRVSFSDVTTVTTFHEAEARLESSCRSNFHVNNVLPLDFPPASFDCKVDTKEKGVRNGHQIDLEEVLRQAVENQKFVMVKNLPWQERSHPYREGRYSGMVNRDNCPHGEGVLSLDSSKSGHTRMKIIRGTWFNGSLITDRWKENIFSKVLQQLQEHQRFHNIDAPKSTSNENLNFYYTSKSKSNNIFNQYRRRSRYTLGETLLVAHDIIQEKSINEDMVNNLQVNDYAFVKRSDQSWTYAHLIKRYNVGGQNGIDNGKATSSGLEHSFEENEVMIFALDHSGQRTKSFTKKKWAKFIKCESRCSSFETAA